MGTPNTDRHKDIEGIKKHPSLDVYCGIDGTIFSGVTKKARKPALRKDGYYQISLNRSSYLSHRLVAESHIPNPQKKPKINHKNGIKIDNRVCNLEWVTQRENIIHARDVLGVKYSLPGFQNSNAKLLESHQIILRNLHARGFSVTEISEIMGFCIPTIRSHISQITRAK